MTSDAQGALYDQVHAELEANRQRFDRAQVQGLMRQIEKLGVQLIKVVSAIEAACAETDLPYPKVSDDIDLARRVGFKDAQDMFRKVLAAAVKDGELWEQAT